MMQFLELVLDCQYQVRRPSASPPPPPLYLFCASLVDIYETQKKPPRKSQKQYYKVNALLNEILPEFKISDLLCRTLNDIIAPRS